MFEDSGSGLSKSGASRQNDAHGELGLTCSAVARWRKRSIAAMNEARFDERMDITYEVNVMDVSGPA